MKILFLVQSTMVSQGFGGEQRTLFLLDALRKIAEVDVLAVVAKVPKREEWKVSNIHYVVDTRFKKWSPSYWIHLILRKTGFLPNLYLPSLFWSDKVMKDVCVHRGYDYIVTRFCPIASRFRPWRYAPTIIDVDDLPTEVYATLTAKQLPRYVAKFGQLITDRWFEWISSRAVMCLLANQEHCQKLTNNNGWYVRNIAKPVPSCYEVDFPPRPKLIMVGSFGHPPNAEGARLFVKNRWPEIYRAYPMLELHIIGGGATDEDLKLFNDVPGVRYRGFVDNLDEEYQDALASVADIYSGSGTCIKVVESVYHRRCCFVSKFASRGAPNEWFENGLLQPIESIGEGIKKLLEIAPSRMKFPTEILGFTKHDFDADVESAISSCWGKRRQH